jgi:molybdate transport system ATP-binding protein
MIGLRYQLHRASFSLDVDVELPMRGITGLFGVSGAGKTTLLRCVAGLEQAGFFPANRRTCRAVKLSE